MLHVACMLMWFTIAHVRLIACGLVSLFLFQFCCFTLSAESFKQFTPELCINSGTTVSCVLEWCETLKYCLSLTCIHAKIAVQYVARVLHFSASSLFTVIGGIIIIKMISLHRKSILKAHMKMKVASTQC